MTKLDFLKYIQQAVDGLEPEDLDALMPDTAQPDLYTIVQELVGLRGEVRKLAQAALKTNNDVQTMLAQQKNMWAEATAHLVSSSAVTAVTPQMQIHDYAELPEYQDILKQIMEQDDLTQRTLSHLETLPELTFWNLNQYRQKMASWRKGYEMTHQKWQQLVKSSGIYATGKVGEPFDPAYHEAIAVKTVLEKAHGTILETELTGYLRGEKVVRRAKVVVNKLVP